MYKIGVIGDRESVLAFKAAGLAVFPCDTAAEAEAALETCAQGDFAIIYMTEQLYQYMGDQVAQYQEARLPAIIPIPSKDGTLGIGMEGVRKAVERAVGADILFGGEQ